MAAPVYCGQLSLDGRVHLYGSGVGAAAKFLVIEVEVGLAHPHAVHHHLQGGACNGEYALEAGRLLRHVTIDAID